MKRYSYLLFLVVLPIFSCQLANRSTVFSPKNPIFIIDLYKYQGAWVFDDPYRGFIREPFIMGFPEMIDELVKDIPDAQKGFRLLFSAAAFEGYTTKLVWRGKEEGGHWYYLEEYDFEGWISPVLFKYFDRAPQEIYVKVETLTR